MGVVALCLSGAGCSLDRQWAEAAWQDVRRTHPAASYSEDYVRGFKDGFEHYLYWGGNGEPPPVPPRRYRTVTYQTPEGYRAIEHWFAGFRHGASAAQESGYRQWVTGPSALRAPDAGPPPSALPAPALPLPAPVPCAPAPAPAPMRTRRGAVGPRLPVILLPPPHTPEVQPEQLGPPTPLPTPVTKDEG